MKKTFLFLFLFSFFLTSCGAPEEVSIPFDTAKLGTVEKDVSYCSDNAKQVLDFYYPAAGSVDSDEPFPLAVYVHGGGWVTGDKGDLPNYREALLSKGVAVAALNYSLADDAIFPQNITDLKCAVRYLRAHAEEYHIDPDRIGGYGGSAGGHLINLLGTTGDIHTWDTEEYAEYSSALSAVVDLYGPTDLTVEFSGNSPELLLQAFGDNSYDQAEEQSPVNYVSSDDPPFLIIHGEEDPVVPIAQSETFYQLLQDKGVEATLIPVANAGHSFKQEDPRLKIDPSMQEITETMSTWLTEQLKASKASVSTSEQSGESAPFYLTTMTHMEGNFGDDENEKIFQRHVAQMRYAIDLFDEYGAKLTFETEQSFAIACTRWNLNMLQEVLDHGHGVGTHADFGANPNESLTPEELTALFKENKALVDDLVGAENNRGVSGGTGPTDWVLAASAAGFEYMDAVTGFGYLSMEESERPEGWTDEYIRSIAYHNPIPEEWVDRLSPLPLKDATDLEPDEDAVITVMGGDIGELASLAEGRIECFPDCTLNQDDVDAYLQALDEALSLRDPAQVARVNVHLPLELFKPENETVLRSFLSSLKTYVDKGEVQWATQLESYEGYAANLLESGVDF